MKFFGITLESWLPWRMASRIRMLSFVLSRIEKGDFSQRAPILQNDIIGGLGVKINEIADSLSRQISVLKHERTQIETIIDNMSEGVIVTDHDGVVVLANAAWYKIFGSSPKSLGLPILESVRVPQIYDGIRRAFSSSLPSEAEFSVGERFYIAKSAPFETAEFKGCVTVLNDVSRLKELENMRRDFTANVSHQMKTPLTSIIGYSETLMEGAIDDPSAARPFVETIRKEAGRLKELIEDVLDLARIESPAYKPVLDDVRLKRLVDEVAGEFRETKKGVKLITDVHDIVIRSDRRAVEHILYNLIDNAVKYTQAGGEVRITGVRGEDGVSIAVSDNGAGIPEEDRERIFERFYRADHSNRLNQEGTGLGLAIVRHLLDKVNGSITVESGVGSGSVFTITLP